MPKTIRKTVSLWFEKIRLKGQGVLIYNNTTFSKVKFLGQAKIEPYCRLVGDPLIEIGNNFYMNAGCHLLGGICIGNDVMIGPKTVIWGRDHGVKLGTPMKGQAHIKEDIIIGDDVWIGANVTILKGTIIGSGAVIGAGSVVTKNVPNNAVAVGNPAKVVKYRV